MKRPIFALILTLLLTACAAPQGSPAPSAGALPLQTLEIQADGTVLRLPRPQWDYQLGPWAKNGEEGFAMLYFEARPDVKHQRRSQLLLQLFDPQGSPTALHELPLTLILTDGRPPSPEDFPALEDAAFYAGVLRFCYMDDYRQALCLVDPADGAATVLPYNLLAREGGSLLLAGLEDSGAITFRFLEGAALTGTITLEPGHQDYDENFCETLSFSRMEYPEEEGVSPGLIGLDAAARIGFVSNKKMNFALDFSDSAAPSYILTRTYTPDMVEEPRAISPDGSRGACRADSMGRGDRIWYDWVVEENGDYTFLCSDEFTSGAAFAGNKRLAIYSPKDVRLFDVDTGRLLEDYSWEDDSPVSLVGLAYDGENSLWVAAYREDAPWDQPPPQVPLRMAVLDSQGNLLATQDTGGLIQAHNRNNFDPVMVNLELDGAGRATATLVYPEPEEEWEVTAAYPTN